MSWQPIETAPESFCLAVQMSNGKVRKAWKRGNAFKVVRLFANPFVTEVPVSWMFYEQYKAGRRNG